MGLRPIEYIWFGDELDEELNAFFELLFNSSDELGEE